MPILSVLVPATLHPGYHASEVLAVVGLGHSALVDVSQVRPAQAVPTDQNRPGQVLAFMVERQADRSLVELPGVAVGGLRGWVPNESIAPLA